MNLCRQKTQKGDYMSFCPLMSNAEKKAECDNDCSFFYREYGCYFRLYVNELAAIKKNTVHMKQKQEKTKNGQETKPFDFISRSNPMDVLNILQQEQPLIIAIVLAHLEPDKSALLLQNFPYALQGEVTRQIATMDRISLEIIHGIERMLEKKLSSIDPYGLEGGVGYTVEMLNLVDDDTVKRIIKFLESTDPELAGEIKSRTEKE
jgi:flagellar motor switch protein FliG